MESPVQLVEGMTSKKVFFSAFAAGLLTLALLLVSFGISGVAYAVPIAGVGDFYTEFDHLQGTGYTFYPKMGETSAESSAPQGVNLIENATITNLKLYKDFKVGGHTLRLEITSSQPVRVTGLEQDAGLTQADATFSNVALAEKHSSDWTKQFLQTSSTIELSHAKILTHYLFQKTMSMGGMKLNIEKIN